MRLLKEPLLNFLLIGALLMGRSLWALVNVDVGWSADNVVVLEPQFRGARYELPDSRSDFLSRLTDSMQEIPGVQVVGAAEAVPLLPASFSFGELATDGASIPDAEVMFNQVSSHYFAALSIPLRQGRSFEPDDISQNHIIVSQDLANRLWAGEDAVGKRLRMPSVEPWTTWFTVIGVAGEIQAFGLGEGFEPLQVYLPLGDPHAMSSRPYRYLVVRSDGRAGLTAALTQQAWRLDPELPVAVRSMDDVFRASVAEPRFHTTLLTAFAVLALLLAGAGVYAVVAYETSQRTQELGIRMALGATRRDVIRHVMGRCILLSLAGVAVGLGGAVVLTRLLSSLLFEVQPTDPMTFAAAAVFLLAAAVAAGYLPARRAATVDPMVVLRAE